MNKLGLLSLFIASSAYAGGFAVTEQTAASAGTGGAGVARDDDPGAAWHQPAALAPQLTRLDLETLALEQRAIELADLFGSPLPFVGVRSGG